VRSIDKLLEHARKKGWWVIPGLVDLHAHFRDPGQTHKEDIETGLKSAAAGGFTTVVTMPNTSPTVDSPEQIKYQIDRAQQIGIARLLPSSALTYGLEGNQVVYMQQNKLAGAIAFTDDGKTVMREDVLEEIFKKAAEVNALVMVHCEEPEHEIIQRDIRLAIKHGVRLHLQHVSTRESVNAIMAAKLTHRHLITAEVTPHHIALTYNPKQNTNFKMSPPLRTETDKLALIEALRDGTIDCIATDHAPHAKNEKSVKYDEAPNGIIGLETAVGVVMTELYHKHKFTKERIIEILSTTPAKIIGVEPVGTTVIDPNATWRPTTFVSKSANSPFIGTKLRGKVTTTIYNDKIVYCDKKVDKNWLGDGINALINLIGEV